MGDLFENYKDIDICIMADTGAELPETYEYIDRYVKPFCKTKGIEFVMIKGLRKGLNLYDHCFKEKIFPFVTFRSCTDHFKLRPLRDWILKNLDIDKTIVRIGYAYDERHRAQNLNGKYYHCETPLITQKITREKCKEIIIKSGHPLPLKSGCFFCPCAPVKFYHWLWNKHPDLAEKALALEKNNRRYPEVLLKNKPLETYNAPYKQKFDRTGYQPSFDLGGDWCVMCHV